MQLNGVCIQLLIELVVLRQLDGQLGRHTCLRRHGMGAVYRYGGCQHMHWQAQQKRQQTREQAARAVEAQRKISAAWEAAALKEQKESDSLLRAQPSSVARDRRKQFARLSSSESERFFVAGSNEI